MTFQRTTFNVKIKIVQRCFVMFTLFNLQGTLAVSEVLFRTSPLIIAFCQPLVKYFFQSFSSFSDFFLSPASRRQKRTEAFGRPLCWRYVSSRSVTRQVLSAQTSLTSVFGMGTGGPSLQSTPTILFRDVPWKPNINDFHFANYSRSWVCCFICRSSPRLISISQLNVLPHLHPWPINDIVYVEPYSISGWEILS